MESTFRLEGQGSIGTGFIIGRPFLGEPTKARYTLVTASHVLEKTKGELITIHLRVKNSANQWQRLPVSLKIREGEHALWLKHPDVDCAAMYIGLPQGVFDVLLPAALLADDETLRKFEIHPGDELNCLGYPFGAESNEIGFPILRSGKIASYPILPTKHVKTFLFDFEVFPGNSGGPVYFIDSTRVYGGGTNVGLIQFIIGLVSQERLVSEQIEELYGRREQRYPLALGEVVHASLIRETIDLLPVP